MVFQRDEILETRREILQGVAASGSLLALFGTNASARMRSDSTGTLIGDFESGLDGWKTDGGVRLSRVSKTDQEGVVTNGDYALAVDPRGDSMPIIKNRKQVRNADLVNNPYLMTDVACQPLTGIDSPLVFQYQLRYSRTGGRGKQKGKSKKRASKGNKPVITSPEITVSPLLLETIQWNLSDVPETYRRNAKEISLKWYPKGTNPTNKGHGRGRGFDYRSETYLDHIRVTDDATMYTMQAIATIQRNLRETHGSLQEVKATTSSKTLESGYMLFSDGTKTNIAAEILAPDRLRLTIDDSEFKMGGGWE